MKVLVTGASGFIGQYAVPFLKNHFEIETVSLRKHPVENLNLTGIDAILHLAGKAHQMQKIDEDEYFKINHRLTLVLANKAKQCGVQQFLFVSSVKVYGDRMNEVLDEHSVCQASDLYGESKRLAEEDLRKLEDKNFVVSIVRPPLVYGHQVKGNLARLIALIDKMPVLPFGNINNQRSMVFVGNLTALFQKILEKKASGTFIAGDNRRPSTSQLIDTMMQEMQVNKINIALPLPFRRLIKKLKPALYIRLFESYIIDNTSTNQRLNFHPPFTFQEGIKEMVKDKL